jgi:hypothetical protein
MPYWQQVGRSNRFAVLCGWASSRSVIGIRLANTASPPTSSTEESPPTPTALVGAALRTAASSSSVRAASKAEMRSWRKRRRESIGP